MKRRERTRHLIELGGLVVKAGLVDLAGDDRAALYGALLTIADTLRGDDRDHALALGKRRGKRAFEAERRDASIHTMKAGRTAAKPPATSLCKDAACDAEEPPIPVRPEGD